MDKAALLALADRVEALTGACRKTDALISATARTGYGLEYQWALKYPAWIGGDDGRVHLVKNGPSFAPPAYTASLDAVMTLIEHGDEWSLSTIYCIARGEVGINRNQQTSWPGMGEHAGCNPVLAFLSAALRAKVNSL